MDGEKKFSEVFCDLLLHLGYEQCFFVAGGNSMHLLDAARSRFECHPVVHEVSAVIAAEYANTIESKGKAWALLTAGPGLTNAVTGIAGSWLESREVLIVGGQVKSVDLKPPTKRQNGIQEIDGIELLKSITKRTLRVDKSTSLAEIADVIRFAQEGRKGPVFIEVPIDISGSPTLALDIASIADRGLKEVEKPGDVLLSQAAEIFNRAERPLFLLGQGVSRSQGARAGRLLLERNVPVATTWTGADRLGFDFTNYVGRPNFFGMRSSNLIIQKADAIFAIGARMGMQQVGFNAAEFAPNAKIVHVDIDDSELESEIPRKALRIRSDGDSFLREVVDAKLFQPKNDDWLQHCRDIMGSFPLVEAVRSEPRSFVSPYEMISLVSDLLAPSDVISSCSSGGTFTAFMQAFKNKTGQVIVSNKGLASMGYGLAGAIGLAFATANSRVILFEGDGGFAQNIQELGTVAMGHLAIKMFVFDNNGYASIRTSQRAHFGGDYVGCDPETGLGLPDWGKLSAAYGISYSRFETVPPAEELTALLESNRPELVHIIVDPEFEYLPKIKSTVQHNGSMISSPLDQMHPPVPSEKCDLAYKYIR